MSTVSADAILTQLQWRYATKKFDKTKKIAPDLWNKLEQAAILAPSSYGLQPWKFFVVTDPAIREKLKPAAWNQSQITDASHLVVFALKKEMKPADAERHIRRVAEVRGVSLESLSKYQELLATALSKPSADVDTWLSRQVYIALGQFLTACALVGVDACPMEGFDSAKFDEILGLKAKGYQSLVLAAVGYRAADDGYAAAAKVRYPAGEVIERI